MTLDEAIKHAEETAYNLEQEAECIRSWGKENDTKQGAINCEKFAEEHRQLAEWLKDYKRLLEQEPKTEKVIKMRDVTPEERESIGKYIVVFPFPGIKIA